MLLPRKPTLPSSPPHPPHPPPPPSRLCSLPSGYSLAQEFALPCGHLACCLVSVIWAQEETATCLCTSEVPCAEKASLERPSAWSSSKLHCPMPVAGLPEGSPRLPPPGAGRRCPGIVGLTHRMSSNLSWWKLEGALNRSDVKNHVADWMG